MYDKTDCSLHCFVLYNFEGEQWTERADATTGQQAPRCWPFVLPQEAIFLLSRHQTYVRGDVCSRNRLAYDRNLVVYQYWKMQVVFE